MRLGDAFTKELRRRMQQHYRWARENDRLDKREIERDGCSDYYDMARDHWSAYLEARQILEIYEEFRRRNK